MATSERWENIMITVSFENAYEKKNTLHVLSTNDETRNNIPDEVNELSIQIPGTHFTGNGTFIIWWQDKQCKQLKSPCFLLGAF